MDFNKIKLLRSYVKKVIKFKKLDKYNNMNHDEFANNMAEIFPNFKKEYKEVFKMVTHNEDLGILNLMFKKLEDIDKDYKIRYNEVNYLRPIVNEVRELLGKKGKVDKSDLVKFLEKNNSEFIEKYPILIDRLLDDDFNYLNEEGLLLEQIKYGHEVVIGNELANKFIYPKINK